MHELNLGRYFTAINRYGTRRCENGGSVVAPFKVFFFGEKNRFIRGKRNTNWLLIDCWGGWRVAPNKLEKGTKSKKEENVGSFFCLISVQTV